MTTPTKAMNIRVTKTENEWAKDLVITRQELTDRYLFGLDQTDDYGNTLPDPVFAFAIRSAQDWLETELGGLVITEREFEETRDYHIADYVSYSNVRLFRFPINEVSFMGVQFPLATNVLQFDPSWYRVESIGGISNLVPTQGTFSSILLSQGGNFLPLIYQGLQYVPAILRIKYKAGFKKGQVPPNILDIIGMKASMNMLNQFGDLIAGAGIASKSIGLDGVSQSISTTSSATNAGYGARIIQYNDEIKLRLDILKRYYVGIPLFFT